MAMTSLEDSRQRVQSLARQLGGRLIETHISWVLLAGGDAFKFKKPLRLPFLDYSTIESRRACCLEEVRVNRRLAPTLYRGVLPVTAGPSGPVLGGDGSVLDYAVHMARFPDGALFSERLRTGRLGASEVDALADLLARFHAQAPRAESGSGLAEPAQRRERALAALAGAAVSAPPGLVRALRAWTESQAQALSPLWAARREQGLIREGHGDLHLANLIVLDEGIAAFDAIEFDASLRWIDVFDDIAFPVMDFDAHGRRDLAFRLLNRWLDHLGGHADLQALRFAAVYRALVRAQVCALRDEAAEPSTARYLETALRWTEPSPPGLTLMHGLPGSGKSWESQRLLEQGAIRLRSDVERKRLAGLDMLADSRAAGMALYDRAASERTYAHLLAQAAAVLAAGFPVVLDAAFLKHAERQAARDLAAAHQVPCTIVSCAAPLQVLRERLQSRVGDPSEATVAVLEQLAARAEALDAQERAITRFVHPR